MGKVLLSAISLCILALWGQSGGRFEEAKRMGMAYIKGEQYDKAAGRLEEVWEQDHSDPTVAEFLAVAYLNTEDKRSLPEIEKRAFQLIDTLIATRARATFMVQHSHEKMTWLQGREMNQYCSGHLSIHGTHVTFVAERGEHASQHSFEVDASEVKGIDLHESDRRGLFQLKERGQPYVFATRNRNRDEARFVVGLLRKL